VRRSGRIPKSIPIVLTGADVEGRVFCEETKTVMLSRHGAGIVSSNKLYPEQEMRLRSIASNREAEIRVIGQIGFESGLYTYGVAFLDSTLDFWGIPFPRLTPAEIDAGLVSIQCSSCKGHESLEAGGMEEDICITNEGVIRFCKNCGSSTVWRQAPPVSQTAAPASDTAPPDRQSAPVVSAQATAVLTAPPPPPSAAPPVNRRKHPRAKVNLRACVRRIGFEGHDLVVCEDMSRGGLRFRTRKHYHEQALIEVAVPYSEGDLAIFVPARIVRVEEFPDEGVFRCGVAFLNSTSSRNRF